MRYRRWIACHLVVTQAAVAFMPFFSLTKDNTLPDKEEKFQPSNCCDWTVCARMTFKCRCARKEQRTSLVTRVVLQELHIGTSLLLEKTSIVATSQSVR